MTFTSFTKNYFRTIILIFIFSLAIFVLPKITFAACANVPIGGNYTVSSSCTFSETVDGVDDGGITVDSGQTLTINANQTVVWSPGSSLVINGQIAINSTGQPANGKRRKDFSNFTYISDFTRDYDDTSTSTYPGTKCAACKSNADDGSCANVTDGTDPWDDCSEITCTDYIYGWSGNNCAKYSGSSANNGDCNGSGACYTAVADSCAGAGATAASCGSAGCKMACVANSVATTYDSVGEICYTSDQHGCESGEECDSAGECVHLGIVCGELAGGKCDGSLIEDKMLPTAATCVTWCEGHDVRGCCDWFDLLGSCKWHAWDPWEPGSDLEVGADCE